MLAAKKLQGLHAIKYIIFPIVLEGKETIMLRVLSLRKFYFYKTKKTRPNIANGFGQIELVSDTDNIPKMWEQRKENNLLLGNGTIANKRKFDIPYYSEGARASLIRNIFSDA
ncbi:unnamed protein product [Sphenostylis stenocarpa]|uniref:Uncharacterized protein n=1 Tax=Sphenostylis stenocarpa TaxID=92480 RepID=A0AA86VVH2_9FABA|nr:unnamed protein product [Sphenostylis stenocarpa]